jgi:soluble lytic murein transglycosylase-like protein
MTKSLSSVLTCAARFFLCGCLCVSSTAGAQIYGGVSSDGRVVLSNFRSEEARAIVVVDGAAPATSRVHTTLPDQRFSTLIQKAARETDLSPGLLHAVIAVESGFNERAVSIRGAKGLMQLMPATANALGVTDPFDPGQNISAGAAHLKSLLGRFDDNLELALAAYNAGADAVVKAGYQVPHFAETRAYVPRVIARLRLADSGTSGLPNERGRDRDPVRAAYDESCAAAGRAKCGTPR